MSAESASKSYRLFLVISIATFLILISFPVFSLMVTEKVFLKYASMSAEKEAYLIANHSRKLLGLEKTWLSPERLVKIDDDIISGIIEDFDLIKLKIFAADGTLVYASDDTPVGKINTEDYFVDIVLKGRPFSKVIMDNALSLEHEKVNASLVESYVPLVRDGRVMGALEVYYDITPRFTEFRNFIKQLHKMLIILPSFLFASLMYTVYKLNSAMRERDRNHRKLSLAHEALEKATTEAQNANEAKSRFLARMSHEIRTPMNGVLGISELLLNTPLNSEQKDCMQMVRISAKRLLRVINDILDLSLVEAERTTIDSAPFGLRETLNNTISIYKHTAREKGLTLRLEIEEDVPDALTGDPERLSQVLINLLGNAIKFTDEGHIVLSVVMDQFHADGIILGFSVSDTGRGMSEETLGLIFDPFTRLDEGREAGTEGTGLGLSIAKGIVQQMGGDIRVESSVNEGSTFYFNARFGSPPGINASPSVLDAVDIPDIVLPEGGCSLRVLVVEDDIISQRIAVKVIEKAGHIPFVANNGLEAVKAIRDGSFDLILMDIEMPEMGGIEATRLIRELEKALNRRIPIIAVTANVMKGAEKRYMDSGMDDMVPKPVSASELLRKIEIYGCN